MLSFNYVVLYGAEVHPQHYVLQISAFASDTESIYSGSFFRILYSIRTSHTAIRRGHPCPSFGTEAADNVPREYNSGQDSYYYWRKDLLLYKRRDTMT